MDVSTLGTYTLTGTAVSGTANKVTVPDFNGSGKGQEGYFLATNIQPNEGASVFTSTHPDKEVKLYGGDEKGDLMILLGTDAPTMEWFELKDAEGTRTRYDLTGITAAAPIALKAKTPVNRAAKKAKEA